MATLSIEKHLPGHADISQKRFIMADKEEPAVENRKRMGNGNLTVEVKMIVGLVKQQKL